jgi:hypothetical protein
MYHFSVRLAVIASIIAAAPAIAQNAPTAPAWTKEDYEASATVAARAQQLVAAPQERGCLGKDAVTCVATIALSTRISSSPPYPGATEVLRFPKKLERDIYGKVISRSVSFLTLITPAGAKPDAEMSAPTYLSMQDGEHVDSIAFSLPPALGLAKTQADWDATAIFELATATMGAKCIGSDRLAFYRLVDKAQKSAGGSTTFYDGFSVPSLSNSGVGSVPICGVVMRVGYVSGVSVSTGHYSGSTLEFAVNPSAAK